MAMGIVNVPGVDGQDLELVRQAATNAQTAADAAAKAAEAAQKTADEAKEEAEHGGGGSGIELADVTGVSVTAANGKVSLNWTDPDDIVYSGATLAKWKGTLLVRKEGSAPTSKSDGVTVIDSTTRNAYATTAYEDTGLTNGTTYYYRFFPHTAGTYTAGTSVNAIPNKQKATISLSENSITLDSSNLTKTVTITTNSDGALSVVSSDTQESVCQVSLSGNTITLTAVDNGTATVTISQADGTDYSAPNDLTLTVTVSLISENLEDNSPADIATAIRAGKASTLWNVGDTIPIKLNGTVGKQTFNNQTFYAMILGFDHNKAKETGGKSSVHFILGKNASGTDIAFCDFDGRNWSYGSNASFRMNLSNTNAGGWKESYMRKTILPQFLAAMPTEWRNVISEITKYSDNTGDEEEDTVSYVYVTATTDKLFLLAEKEIFGSRSYANPAEQNYQERYAYYANGNSTIRKNHRDGTTAVIWWERSVDVSDTARFCDVYYDGTAQDFNTALNTHGLAPGFAIC